MWNAFVIWLLKDFLRKRVIMVTYYDGHQKLCVARKSEANKVYVHSEDGRIGFLDNPSNKAGEFRKGISDDNLARWAEV
jgi:predicted DCC family thiol-disulfide oxidoreductase YuxK